MTSGRADGPRTCESLCSKLAALAGGDVASLILFTWIDRASHISTAVDWELLKSADPFIAGQASPLLPTSPGPPSHSSSSGNIPPPLPPSLQGGRLLVTSLRTSSRTSPPPWVSRPQLSEGSRHGPWEHRYLEQCHLSAGDRQHGG